MNLIELVKDQLSGDVIGKLSGLIGEGEGKTRAAVSAAVPALLAGLSSVAETGGGAQKLATALGGLDTNVLGNLGGLTANQAGGLLEKGMGLLTSLFGNSALSGIVSTLSKFAGLDTGTGKKLIGYLMPMVLGVIAKQFHGRAPTAQGLTDLFAAQKENIADALPPGLSLDAVSGLATRAATAARGYAEPVGAGRSPLTWVVPLIGLGALGLLWYVYMRPAAPPAPTGPMTAAPAPKTVETLRVPTPDAPRLGTDLTAAVTTLTETLSGVKDAATADTALPKLKEIDGNLDAMKATFEKLPEAGRGTIITLVKDHLGKVKDLIAKVTAIPGVGEKLKPTLDDIMAKMTALAG
jgi:hypothetical protein